MLGQSSNLPASTSNNIIMFDGYKIHHKHLVDLFCKAREDAKATLSSSRPISQKHNRYCMYNLLTLMYATGARPVNDTLYDLNRSNFEHGLAALQDKEVSETASLHFVGLGDIVKQQGNFYIDHLTGLASQYLTQYGETYNLVRGIARKAKGEPKSTLPFFFLIEGDRTNSITPSDLINYLAEFIALPPNFNRHAVSAHLSEDSKHKFSFSEISAFLGHQPIGFHLFGAESELCQQEVLNQQASSINDFFISMSYAPLKGIKPHKKDLIINEHFKVEEKLHLVDELGPHKRARKREQRRLADIELSEKVISFLDSAIQNKTFNAKTVKQLRKEVKESYFPVGNHWSTLINKYSDTSEFLHIFPKIKRKLRLTNNEMPFNERTIPELLKLKSIRAGWITQINKKHAFKESDSAVNRFYLL